MSDVELAENALSKKKKEHKIPMRDLLSSSSTMLNLAATGRTVGCYAKGHYYWFVGSSESGKTWLALAALAEASINPNFDGYRIIHDDSENGALMNIKKFFGQKVYDRIEPPRGTKEEPEFSETVEDMYETLDQLIEEGEPFIYIEDSMDALRSRKEEAREKKKNRAEKKGKKVAGDFGMEKAKTNSRNLRRIVAGLKRTKSILIIISQTRSNVGFGAIYDPEKPSGGKALKFYATLEIWTKSVMKLKKVVMKKKRQIGILTRVRIKKNRIEGKDRTIDVPIYHSVGVDDIGSCIDFLVSEGHWKGNKAGTRVVAPEFDYDGSKEGLVKEIEDNENEAKLRAIVKEVWNAIEFASRVERKSRYS